ncbi:hypothetical protein [Methylobacterium radiodurans]|uniref:Uncharacterized protein n=1 Tax=Methylobacterium radiodurans TaxID=2202828 RepID=A0A2U8VMT3_9HYPH|nr:hypothetical protein [Methylobacterium radiodurans]AWN34676.1 hypothetical protein DK427_02105 [Methylobacterium radiodurans]
MPTDIRPRHPAFDPFGERIDGACLRVAVPDGSRARNLAVALFWSVALLLVVGRVHLDAHAASPPAAHASVQVAAGQLGS